jgi:threonyl-tRNA synthetase
MMKVPYMAVVGKREAESGSIALRVRGTGKKQEIVSVDSFVDRVRGEIASRALAPNVAAGIEPVPA